MIYDPISDMLCQIKNASRKSKEKLDIPASNIKHLMLDEKVVEAVKKGKFHIYPVANINEGIEILTGLKAGERDSRGMFPKNTVNYFVDRRLRHYDCIAARTAGFENTEEKRRREK